MIDSYGGLAGFGNALLPKLLSGPVQLTARDTQRGAK